MKRFFIFVFILVIGFVASFFVKDKGIKSLTANSGISETIKTTQPTKENNTSSSEDIYAVWLTYSEIGELVKGKSEDEYRESLEALFDNLKENKINTVFYQCRAFCDSLYNSEIFPVSKYISSEKEKLSFDPFEIFTEKGKEKGIAVHCWINPYRASYDNEFKNLPENSPVRELYKKDKNALIICNKGIFLNPAHPEGRSLVLKGIREILEKYRVSGIHFDDYFYPESENINDKALYEEYLKNGGNLSSEDWRRENVNALVGAVHSLVKSFDESLVFSISPSADIEKCKNVFYADVEEWCVNEGYLDYIIPQIYYGFKNEKMPFEKVLSQWTALGEKGNVKLICGLATYKCGRVDEFAGAGEKEWTENVNILSTQYEQVLKSPVWQGFSLFSYSYCFGENMSEISKKEIKNLLYMVE